MLAAATSCDEYDIYPEQYGEVMMIKDAGERAVTIYATDKSAPCYISVMKSGHTPENPAQATLKILNEKEFGDYKELYYGRKDFEGLVMLKPEFFHLEDLDGNKLANGALSHDFVDENDRYFGANVVFDAQLFSDWYQRLETAAAYNPRPGREDPDLMLEKEMAEDTLNSFTFVVPVGLFSATDSINADNKYLMIQPTVTNPVLSVSVGSGAFQLTDISRTALKEDQTFRNGILEPDVTLSIPCPNPYGFQVKYLVDNSFTETFNKYHTDIVLTTLPKNDREAGVDNYKFDGTYGRIDFPKDVTEVRLPLSIFRQYIDIDNMETNWVVPIQLKAATGDSKGIDMIWDSSVPEKVQKSLKLPERTKYLDSNGSVIEEMAGYNFYVGYRVLETPLEITDDNFVYANDCEPTEGSFAALFDDDLSTFYHSAWSDPQPRSTPYGSYIDMLMPTKEPINAIAMQITSRVHSNPHTPKKISLYYSNIDNDDERNASWKPIVENYVIKGVDKAGSGKSYWIGGIKKDSEWIIAPEAFRYLRFCVIENAQDELLTVTGTSAVGYWNLAEMKIYGTVIKK